MPVLHVPGRALDVLCRGRPHQGVCLEASPLPFRSLRDAEEPQPGHGESGRRQRLWLVLEHIQDPMNLGALLRAAYFLGVDRVVATHSNSCPLTPIVSKASAGAMEVFDVYSTDDLQGFLKAKSAEGWEVVGTVSRSENVEDVPVISCSEFCWDKPLIVVIGIYFHVQGCGCRGNASLQGLFQVWKRKGERESWNGLAVNEAGTERNRESWGGSQKEQFVDAQRVQQLGRV